MKSETEQYYKTTLAKLSKNPAFRHCMIEDAVEIVLDTNHKAWDTLTQPYLIKEYNMANQIEPFFDFSEEKWDTNTAKKDLGRYICGKYTNKVHDIEDNYPKALEWLESPKNVALKTTLETIQEALASRLEKQLSWHNRFVTPLGKSRDEVDTKTEKVISHYKKAILVTLYQYYLSQFPKLLDKAGKLLPPSFAISRKYAEQTQNTDVLHSINEDNPIFRAKVIPTSEPLSIDWKKAQAEQLKSQYNSETQHALSELLRVSVPLGDKFSDTQYVLPIEKLMYQCYPHTMLSPTRLRYKGAITSEVLTLLADTLDNKPIKITEFAKAYPEIKDEFSEKKLEKFKRNLICEQFIQPELDIFVDRLSESLAKKIGLKLNKNDTPTLNKIRLYSTKEGREQLKSHLYDTLKIDSRGMVDLYVIQADEQTRTQLQKLRAHSDTPLPELSSEPGISFRKVTCTKKEARELCNTVQCISEPHRKSMGILPFRDIALQGIYTTFDIKNIERSFGWYIDNPDMSASVSNAAWDVYFHMGKEGALQFPYHHRSGYPGQEFTGYNAALEERIKGIPITNTRKPAGSDMSTGKYKKSMNPTKAGITVDMNKYANNLPYFTVDTLSPEFKELSYRLLACDYLKMTDQVKSQTNIDKYVSVLKVIDPIAPQPDVDDKNRKIVIIEGEKKTLALKGIKDAAYIDALNTYDLKGIISRPQIPPLVSMGVGGVWFTKSKSNQLNTDMEQAFDPENRDIGLCFDKDSAVKPQVAQAFLRAAHAFKSSGARDVYCQLLLGPNQVDEHAKGLDDEIDALFSQKGTPTSEIDRMRKVQECYSEYAEVFHRCSLPARTSISFDKEQEMLNYVDKSAKNIIKVLGISPEVGVQYLPEPVQYEYCTSMVKSSDLSQHIELEKQIKLLQKKARVFER